ncbi:ribosomal protein S10 [Phellopilus nigrolimitatus]|nr:ribosomal protein S10 [Phellopilus nigrolimitatus]
MLARQARASLARTEQLLKGTFHSRLALSRGFATEATTPRTPSPSNSSPPFISSEEVAAIEREFSSKIIHGRSVFQPLRHPKTHGIPVATLHVRGYNHRALDFFLHFASHAAAALGIPVSQPVSLPTQRSMWTVLKGPFVHKKSQENFDRKVHKRVIKAWDATDGVVERWIRYLQMFPQPSIGLRIVRWHRAPIGIGRKHAETTTDTQKETMRLENVTDRERVKKVAKKIVKQETAAANLTPAVPKVITQKKNVKASKNVKDLDSCSGQEVTYILRFSYILNAQLRSKYLVRVLSKNSC